MAWPCISRVCCLARFWNQFDKSDLSVPLTIQNYSDITEHEVRSVTKQVCASERAPANDYSSPPRAADSFAAHADNQGPQGSFKTRREPSNKHREDYQPAGVPFPSVTQYKQDYKPWPIPRKDNFPWISNGTSPLRGNREKVPGKQQQSTEPSPTSSYRQEFKAWTGVKPAKSSRKNIPIQCATPGTEAAHVTPETSYQAAYSGDSVCPSASSVQTVHQTHSPPSSQHTILTEGEENMVRAKVTPNPAAIFQSGSGVFNI